MSNDDILPGFDEDTCDSLLIRLEKVQGIDHCLVLELSGQIDTYSSHFFLRSVKRAIDAGFINLVFLLGGVDYMSSMGIGALMQHQKAVRERGGDIALVDVQPKIGEIFKIMCLDKFFACSDSLDEALAPIRGNEKTRAFPKAIQCPVCDKRLRASRSGQFRCPACKSILSIDEAGRVFLL